MNVADNTAAGAATANALDPLAALTPNRSLRSHRRRPNEEPTTHTVRIKKLRRWIKSNDRRPREEAKKEELRKLLFGNNK